MARASYADMIERHGRTGSDFVQKVSAIQRNSLNTREASLAKALLNAFYKGILAEIWIKDYHDALKILGEAAALVDKGYKIVVRRPNTGKSLGPDNWSIQGVKPHEA